METLVSQTIRVVLQDLDNADNLHYVERLARHCRYSKRRYCVSLQVPKFSYCNYEMKEVVYPLTLTEILNVRRHLKNGHRVDVAYKPVCMAVVCCRLKFNVDEFCDCYSCIHMK